MSQSLMNHLRISGHHLKNPLKHHRSGSNESPVSPTGPNAGEVVPASPRSGPGTNPSQGGTPGGPPGPATGGGGGGDRSSHQRSIAEQYEVDKSRIIKSCFSRVNEQGRLIDSYVTHVRITEDSQYPSERPPPDSAETNKKHRVIIISVKDSGNVCVHKARENPNGSFQIGKTWSLDLLSSIVNDPASINGFTITLGKDYYWQTRTGREHDTFLTSIVRIYKKFTKGNVPHLEGLDHIIKEDLRTPTSPQSATRSPRQYPQQQYTMRGPIAPGPGSNQSPIAASPPLRGTGPGGHEQQFRPGAYPGMPRSGKQPPPSQAGQNGPMGHSGQGAPRPQQYPRDAATRSHPSDLPRLQTQPAESQYDQRGVATPTAQFSENDRSLSNVVGETSADKYQSPIVAEMNHAPLRINKPQSPLVQNAPPQSAPQVSPLTIPRARNNSTSQHRNAAMAGAIAGAAAAGAAATSLMSNPVLETRRALEQGTGPNQRRGSRSFLESSPVAETQMAIHEPIRTDDQDEQEEEEGEEDDAEPDEAVPVRIEQPVQPIRVPFNEVTFDADTLSNKSENSQVHGTSPYTLRPSALPLESVPSSSSGSLKILSNVSGMPQLTVLQDTDGSDDEEPPVQQTVKYEREQVEVTTTNQTSTSKLTFESVKQSIGPAAESNVQMQITETPPPRSRQQQQQQEQRQIVDSPQIAKSATPEMAFSSDQTSILDTLAEFGWTGKEDSEAMETLITNRINRLNKQNVSNVVNLDAQLDELDRVLDGAETECGNIGRMLSFAAIQLNSFGDDIGHIEGQSQGVQVETTNQKLLWTELSRLLETIGFHESRIRVLQDGNFHKLTDVNKIESSAVELFRAVEAVRHTDKDGGGSRSMRVVRERRALFESKAHEFNQRFYQFFEPFLGSLVASASGDIPKMSFYILEHCYLYSALILFAKQTDDQAYRSLVTLYEKALRRKWGSMLSSAFRKQEAQIPQLATETSNSTGAVASNGTDSQNLDLTPSPTNASVSSLTSSKTKLKRTGTLAKLRDRANKDREKIATSTPNNMVIPEPAVRRKLIQGYYQLFHSIVEALVAEQEVVVRLFHLSSSAELKYPDYIRHVPANTRTQKLTFVYEQCLHEIDSDYNIARELAGVVGAVFSQLPDDMNKFVTSVVNKAGYSALALMALLDGYINQIDKTNQDYLLQILSRTRDHLNQAWSKIMDSRPGLVAEAITAYASKKWRGVVPAVRAYAQFCQAVEEDFESVGQFLQSDSSVLNAYQLATSTYDKIGRSVVHTLERQAADASANVITNSTFNTPGASATVDQVEDSEDKEKLNHHILMIYNMHVLMQFQSQNEVLQNLAKGAKQSFDRELDLYVRQVMHRPVGKLLDFVESKHQEVTRHAFKKAVAGYDNKELRKGLDTLRKRVEKHFDEDSRVEEIVWTRIRNGYYNLHRQLLTIEEQVSLDSPLLEFSKADITAGFGR